jgi:hypothetical protein
LPSDAVVHDWSAHLSASQTWPAHAATGHDSAPHWPSAQFEAAHVSVEHFDFAQVPSPAQALFALLSSAHFSASHASPAQAENVHFSALHFSAEHWPAVHFSALHFSVEHFRSVEHFSVEHFDLAHSPVEHFSAEHFSVEHFSAEHFSGARTKTTTRSFSQHSSLSSHFPSAQQLPSALQACLSLEAAGQSPLAHFSSVSLPRNVVLQQIIIAAAAKNPFATIATPPVRKECSEAAYEQAADPKREGQGQYGPRAQPVKRSGGVPRMLSTRAPAPPRNRQLTGKIG